MLQMSLNTAHKFLRGHNPYTDLFLSLIPTSLRPPTHLTHSLCLSRSLILQFYHAVSISHFLSHTYSDLSHFLFSRSPLIPTSLHKHAHTLQTPSSLKHTLSPAVFSLLPLLLPYFSPSRLPRCSVGPVWLTLNHGGHLNNFLSQVSSEE